MRLLRADPHRGALLLERLDTRDLNDSWDLEACQIVGSLYGLLHAGGRSLPDADYLTMCVTLAKALQD